MKSVKSPILCVYIKSSLGLVGPLGGLPGARECQTRIQLTQCCLYVVSKLKFAYLIAHSWPYTHIYTYAHIYTHIYTYIHIYTYMHICPGVFWNFVEHRVSKALYFSREPWKPLFRGIPEITTSPLLTLYIPHALYTHIGFICPFSQSRALEAPGCSRRLKIGQKCTARHAECDEQLEIRIAYSLFVFCFLCF
jgi:hypothetical protein